MNREKKTILTGVLFGLCITAFSVKPATAANSITISPEAMVRLQQTYRECNEGEAALKAKDYATAETDFNEVNAVMPMGAAYFGLALAYTAQGRTAEAFQAYQSLFHPEGLSFGGTYLTRAHLEYALLLIQSGKWKAALASYQDAVPTLPGGDLPKVDAAFDPSSPQPALLAAVVHLALGLDATFHCDALNEYQHGRAFQEYGIALLLAPDWPVANYYYGYGWQRLDPKSPARAATARQAKAALQKAAAFGEGDVKKAAGAALTGFK